jgi:hypothetical protein
MRPLRTAFPSRSPLLPAQTCSRRAASVFPTQNPQRGKCLRSEPKSLLSEQQQGRPIRKRTEGSSGTAPAPKTTARFQSSPNPFLPPQRQQRARCAHDRGKCTETGRAYRTGPAGRVNCKGAEGTGEFPKPRSPGPLPPSPGPRARSARHCRLAYRVGPAIRDQQPGCRHPGAASIQPAEPVSAALLTGSRPGSLVPERIRATKARHPIGVYRQTVPPAFLLSRTMIMPPPSRPTSTHSPPLPLRLEVRHPGFRSSIAHQPISVSTPATGP